MKNTILFFFIFSMVLSCKGQEDSKSLEQDKNIKERPTKNPYERAEEMPIYYGCEDVTNKFKKEGCTMEKVLEFIRQNLILTNDLKEIKGRVFVEFDINKQGEVENIEIMESLNPKADQLAMDVIKKLPKFIPAKNKGIPCRVRQFYPVQFN